MIRDPFYRDVVNRLAGPLHEEAFEHCAQDLLRRNYPTLVPIRGGCDGGMDGVTADLNKNQIVLVVTAGERVKRNLETSLQSMLSAGNPCRKIVIATSQKLSAAKLKELRDTARTLGFRVVQIYEQAAMADLLYHSPKWCKELLNLTGDPPPLSIVPRSERPTITDVLIGRGEDAQWLTETKRTRLLVGQPGSGKTFLVSALAKHNGWLFLVNQDASQIANGIRSQKPTALVVDDAHLDPDFLSALTRLLKELDAEIPIIATCWPGARDRIVHALHLPKERVRELGPLTRPEVMSVLESVGLTGPRNLIHQILNQAEGRPGLAITLAYVCVEGDDRDLKEVIRGDALVRSVRTSFEPLVSPYAIEVLAAFAIGGGAGMSMQVVADYFGKSLADIRLTVTGLSAGGVIRDVDGQHLSVRPPEMRYALIRDVFFSGATSLDIAPLLAHVPSLSEATETLVNACHYGAVVPTELLHHLLEQSDSQSAWESYAWLGPDESRLALRKYPEYAGRLTEPALHHIPEITIPLLLKGAIGDTRALHSHPDHALRLIEDWIKRGWPGTGEATRRRKSLLDAARRWLESGGNAGVGLHAVFIAMTPRFESHSTDPVLGNTVTRCWGLLPLQELEEVAKLWPRAIEALKSVNDPEWHHVVNAVSDWVCPQRHARGPLPDELSDRMRDVAKQMLRDIVDIGHHSAGLVHRAAELAEYLEIVLEVPPNSDFETLFPPIRACWTKGMEMRARAIKQLAERWAGEEPPSIVDRIIRLEQEATVIDERNRQTPWLADELAERISNPLEWIKAILDANAIGDLVAPFLLRASRIDAPNWESTAIACLSQDASRNAAASIILTMKDPPESVLEATLQSLQGMSKQIECQCIRNLIPETTIRCLLAHEDDSIVTVHRAGSSEGAGVPSKCD